MPDFGQVLSTERDGLGEGAGQAEEKEDLDGSEVVAGEEPTPAQEEWDEDDDCCS